MSDDARRPDHSAEEVPPAQREDVSFKGILLFTVALVVLVAVAGVAMYGLTVFLRDAEIAQDPPPPALPEARRPHEPPAPRLQSDPIRERVELSAEEEAELSTYGWVDEAAGLARVPIERAMELMLQNGSETGSAAEGAGESPMEAPPEGEAG